jgi:hypothetical protein
MHFPATANPVTSMNRRPVMIAITEAVLEYDYCEEPVSESYTTILINRELAISLRAVTNPAGMQPGNS